MKAKSINLALQGGGAHGAFTWGVLDRLLQEDWLHIAAISGTSAGALNGAALKAGLAQHPGRAGRQAARENLDHLWKRVRARDDSRLIRWAHSMMPPASGFHRLAEMFSPAAWADAMTRIFSPYDYGPFYINPLEAVLRDLPYPDFGTDQGPELFVAATCVRTGRLRVFTGTEATPDAVLASACLPSTFRAIEIEDPRTGKLESYWDGGYSANPALFPLYRADLPRDIVIVKLNPLLRNSVPRTPVEIQDRENEISFNSSLIAQLRAIHFVKELFAENRLKDRSMKDVLLHMILDDKLMNDMGARSKARPVQDLLTRMHRAGQQAADAFLQTHADSLNVRDSVDLAAMFPDQP